MVINNSYSTYDLETHTPYPNNNFIKNETGEDMIVLVGSELKARAEIRQITDSFKRALRTYHLTNTFNVIEFLIATDKDWRSEFIKSVAAVIYAEYNTEETRDEAINRIIEQSHLLKIYKFSERIEYTYRVGY